jgi:glutamine amidotransferase
MCLAIYKPKSLIVDEDDIYLGFLTNPDGAGFSYKYRGAINIEKGFFGFDDFYDVYQNYQELECCIHFRLATHGIIDEDNCHPFPVNKKLALLHNGIIDIPCPSIKKSDTWHFVEQYIKPNAGEVLNNLSLQRTLKKVIGYSKVILHGTNKVVILNECWGEWVDGVWFSNNYFRKNLTGEKQYDMIDFEDRLDAPNRESDLEKYLASTSNYA